MGQSTTKRQFLWAFRGGLKQGLPLAGLYTAAMLATAANSFLMVARSMKANPTSGNWYEYAAEQNLLAATLFGGLVLAALLGLLQMKYLYKREETDFYHALPVKRKTLFFGKLTACLVCLWVPLLLGGVLRTVLYGYMFGRYFAVADIWDAVGKWLLLQPLLAAVMGLAFLAAALGRSLFQSVLFLGAMTGIWPALYILGAELIGQTVPNPNMDLSNAFTIWLSPVAAVFYYAADRGGGGWGQWYTWYQYAWWWVAAVLLCLAAYKIYVNRKSGLAKQAYGGLKTGLSLFVALCAALLAGAVSIYQTPSQAAFYALSLVAGAVAYCVCQMLFFHRLRLCRKRLLPFAAVPVVFVGFCVAVSFGLGLDGPPAGDDRFWSNLGSGRNTGSVCVENESRDGALFITLPAEAKEGVILLEKTLIEAVRERAYPYPMGARHYDDTEETQCVALSLARVDGNRYGTSTRYYWISASPDMSKAQKARDMQAELLKNQDLIKSMFAVNAVDALTSVQRAGILDSQGYFTSDGEKRLQEVFLADLENQADFRQKLENALLADFTAGRQLDTGNLREPDLPVGSRKYVLCYSDGAPFTARGGELNGEPAAGKSFRLASSDYVSVTARMTETYALLAPLYDVK